MNTHTHLRTSSATSTQKMKNEPSPCAFACRWLDSLMLHVRRRTKLINMASGYNGSGYSRWGRRPYGCTCTPAKCGGGDTGGDGEGACGEVPVVDASCSCIAVRTSA